MPTNLPKCHLKGSCNALTGKREISQNPLSPQRYFWVLQEVIRDPRNLLAVLLPGVYKMKNYKGMV